MPTTTADPDRIPIGKAAHILGVDTQTLRRWERDGRITASRTPTGHRRYAVADIEQIRNARHKDAS